MVRKQSVLPLTPIANQLCYLTLPYLRPYGCHKLKLRNQISDHYNIQNKLKALYSSSSIHLEKLRLENFQYSSFNDRYKA